MHFTYTTLLFVAAHLALVNAVALPAARDHATQQQHQPRAGGGGAGGIVEILKDHGKYVAKPSLAEEPIPEAENNALRETHRQAHKTIFEVALGGGGNKAGKDKAGKDKGEAPANETEEAAAL
ncbi:hypothetical protein BBO_06158 [Beauveria brongniartii RCEF 3172]|uniref:Uncharacterized protein n=1 Tax=Beauveria brongniartii RCEF 3172 TaxID=1081107 RepID=A0A167BJ82_9HYPO|nr:hypothetical protein BBO_06158 [Beauveria brongniartii RCEF 3172]